MKSTLIFTFIFLTQFSLYSQTFVGGHSDIENNHILKPVMTLQNKASGILTSSQLSIYNNENYRLDIGMRSSLFGSGPNNAFIQSLRPLEFWLGGEPRMAIDTMGRVLVTGDDQLKDTVFQITTDFLGKEDVVGLHVASFPDGQESQWGAAGIFQGGWRGVIAESNVGIAITASSDSGEAINATSTSNVGVTGISNSAIGVRGISIDTAGVFGSSNSNHGIIGESKTAAKAGVSGYSLDDFGVGIFGVSNLSAGVIGNSSAGTAVLGSSDIGTGVAGFSSSGVGMDARSTTNHGIIAATQDMFRFDFKANGPGLDYGTGSSRRWKSNIQNIANPLEIISQLRGVRYDWDMEHGGGRHDIGFIAEEVGAVLPEIVTYEENGVDAIAMDYSKVTSLLVEAVNKLKEQYDAKFEEQELLINQLQTTLNEILEN